MTKRIGDKTARGRGRKEIESRYKEIGNGKEEGGSKAGKRGRVKT